MGKVNKLVYSSLCAGLVQESSLDVVGKARPFDWFNFGQLFMDQNSKLFFFKLNSIEFCIVVCLLTLLESYLIFEFH